MLIPRNFIPSLFTILNAFCGFMSIISSSNGEYTNAALFILYAMLFDAFDGLIARLLKSSSDFGVELDSLCDVVSFGAAPSFLLYCIYFRSLEGIGILLSSLILVFSAIRLARFNVQLVGHEKDSFKGVPTPMSAAVICSYVIFYHNNIFSSDTSVIALYILAIGLPLLMVSRFKYDSMPKFSKKAVKLAPVKFVIVLACIVAVIATAGKASLPVLILYLLTGIFRSIRSMFTKKTRSRDALDSNDENEEDELKLEDARH